MPEYECYPIWISKNGGIYQNIASNQLNITKKLISEIEEWDNIFEKTYRDENPLESGFKENDLVSFEKKGIEIWKQLISELSEYEIIYKSQINFKEYMIPEELENEI